MLFRSLQSFSAQMVFYNGKPIDSMLEIKPEMCPPQLLDTVHLAQIDPKKLEIRPGAVPFPVIRVIPGEITTKQENVVLPGTEGGGVFVPNGEINKIATFERHHFTGKVGAGAIAGFGIRGGAIASSVSHDSHNIIAVGDNDEDILLAVEELNRTHGGYTIVENGKVFDTLELPVMGLISERSYSEVSSKVRTMTDKAYSMGVPRNLDPFITLSFMALPVIPEIRCTARGIFSVMEWKLLT